jgi:outer membrane protein TolC
VDGPAARIRLTSHDADAIDSETTEQVEEKPEADEVDTGSVADDSPPAHPIDLATVLQLTNGQNPQVAFARERIQEAFAQLDRAQVLWLPSLRAGVNYNKHEGSIQDVAGTVFNTSRGAFYTGFGAAVSGAASPMIPGLYANFHIADAIFQPRIAERTAAARQSAATAATNDALLEAALAYLELLRAEQDLAIARAARGQTRQLADLTGAYAQTGKGTQADHERALAELALRENDVLRSNEAIGVASARLAQQLSLDPLFAFEPREPTIVPIELVPVETPAARLVALGLTNRPEVAESRHLVGEAVERLQREKLAPLIPSVLLGISYGGYGGGLGSTISNFNNRFDGDAIAFWEVRNLGFGDEAVRCEAQSRVQQAQWKEVAALDRVAREIVEAHTQVRLRKEQIATAQGGVEAAIASYERNLERIKNVQGLPIEVLQSIQALAQARREYLRSLVAYNEAQFRLQRALGWPVDAR